MNRRNFLISLGAVVFSPPPRATAQSAPQGNGGLSGYLDDFFGVVDTLWDRATRLSDRNDRHRVLEFVTGIHGPLSAMQSAKNRIKAELQAATCVPAQVVPRGASQALSDMRRQRQVLADRVQTLSEAVRPVGMAADMTALAQRLRRLGDVDKRWVDSARAYCSQPASGREAFLAEIDRSSRVLDNCLARLDALIERLNR